MALGLLLGLGVLVGTAASRAQDETPVAWEYIGLLEAQDLDFKAAPGSDTLFALADLQNDGIHRQDPVTMEWSGNLQGAVMHFIVTEAGTLLGGAGSGPIRVVRSTDGGRTWAGPPTGEHNECLYQSPTTGAIYGGPEGNEEPLHRSMDDGQTWQELGFVPDATEPSAVHAFTEHPTAAPGGAPRLVAGIQNGIAYSDDGGVTWTRSNIWQPFRWFINEFVAPQAGPYAGILFAAARDFDDTRPVVPSLTTAVRRGRNATAF